jgi:hypothetical protein
MSVEDELFEIQLQSIDRELDVTTMDETYEVEFSCHRTGSRGMVTVSVEAEVIATTDIVPVAMSRLHRTFAALAEQTRAWRIGAE